MNEPLVKWTPALDFDFESMEKAEGARRMRVTGVLSTEKRDRDGEVIRQDGLDLSDFKFLTYEHPLGHNNVVGEATKIGRGTVTDDDGTLYKATLLEEGFLYDHMPLARELWETARLMRKSGASRGFGLSVEGHYQERNRFDRREVLRSRADSAAISLKQKNALSLLTPLAAAASAWLADGRSMDDLISMVKASLETHEPGAQTQPVLNHDPVNGPAGGLSPIRQALVKGLTNAELAGLRFLKLNPDYTLPQALELLDRHEQAHGVPVNGAQR